MLGSTALPDASGHGWTADCRPLPPPSSSSPPPPPRKAKRRFDIESLLAEPGAPPRRSPLGPPAASAALALGPPFPGLYLAGTPLRPTPPPPPCLCAHPGCPRPALDLSSCVLAHSLGAPLPWRSGGSCKMKRVRTIFTPEQLERLEKEFLKQQYMVGTERVDLAAALHLTETQVKVWFQNRRIKWRKQSLEQKAAKQTQAGAMAAVPAEQPEEKDSDENDVDIED